MSDDGQDVELRVLVAQTLENNGVLSKIRAELRASVFLALEEQDGDVKTQITNKPFKEFVSSAEGSLILSLVRELLEFFELTYTLSVFDPETRCGKDYRCDGRSQLAKDLKIKNTARKAPLLLDILRLARGADAPTTNSRGNAEKTTNHVGDRSPTDRSASNEVDSTNHSNASNGTSPIADRSGRSLSHSTAKSEDGGRAKDSGGRAKDSDGRAKDGGIATHKDNSSPANSSGDKTRDERREKSSPGSTFPLLGNLPPLLNSGKTSNDVEKAKGRDLNVLNSELLGLALGDSPENYDEDFHSSISAGSAGDGAGKESDSEIEEDINSNHSVVDDVVVDATLSNSSGVADYMEDVTSNAGGTYHPKVNLNTK